MLGMGAVVPALAAVGPQATQTSLTAETRDVNGRTQAMLSVAVEGEDGTPVTGPIVIQDGTRQLAGVVLNGEGKAQITLGLLPVGTS